MSRDDALDVDRLPRDAFRFRRRSVALAPAEELILDPSVWMDAVVFLDAGELELECVLGERRSFAAGAVLRLSPPVRVLRNPGACPARLVAISRRRRATG